MPLINDGSRRRLLPDLEATADVWLPTVQRLRPGHSWSSIAKVLAEAHPQEGWNATKLSLATRRMVYLGRVGPEVLKRQRRQ